jgi:hypothetical protein
MKRTPFPLTALPALLVVAAACNNDKAQDARLAALEGAVAAAASANQGTASQVQRVASAQASASAGLSARLSEVELRTPGIGYFQLAWSYKGIAGATSLNVRGTPTKDKPDVCRVSGAFTHSGALPSPVMLSVFKEGGQSVFETAVTLTEGGFDVGGVPVNCEHIKQVAFSPKI